MPLLDSLFLLQVRLTAPVLENVFRHYSTLSLNLNSDFNISPSTPGMRQKLHTGTIPWSKIVVFEGYRDKSPQMEGIDMREKIEEALARIRPALQADGGDVQLMDVKEGVVTLKLTGACGGCPMSTMTLRLGIERVVKEQVPEIKEVIAV
jgi:Fe-S cluster biogenesis protein NfuA